MKTPEIPENEAERQLALDALNIVYTPTEERFERITRVAKRLFDVPITLISLISNDKQWFKSCQGLAATETDREVSFCAHAITRDEVFVVPNAAADPDFRDNPLVTGEPKIRFYAGQPLTVSGQRIGTLCIVDRHPRQFKPKDYDSLRCLASWAEMEITTWNDKKNVYLNEFLALENRQTLIDPVTGDLNSTAFGLLSERLQGLGDKSTPSSLLDVSTNHSMVAAADADLSRKDISRAIHSALDDRGIVGSVNDNDFKVILLGDGAREAPAIAAQIENALASLRTGSEGRFGELTFTVRQAA